MTNTRIPNSFYWKLAGICFVLGGCMEGFMYATGFYNVVTKKEAEKYALSYEERLDLLRKLRETGLLEEAAPHDAAQSSGSGRAGPQ